MGPSEKNLKKITVITTVLNGEKGIAKTIQSVINQDYPAIEYLIIDAGSTDNTLAILEKYRHKISKIIIKPNTGIFEGMNIGIDSATGEWIIFLNSGDKFTDEQVLSKIFSSLNPDQFGIIYGNHIADYGDFGRQKIKVKNNLPFWKRYINHQSIFIKTSLLRQHKFSNNYKICGDYEILVHLYYKGENFNYIDLPVSIRSGSGYSDLHRIAAYKENIRIAKNYIPALKVYSFYYFKIITYLSKNLIKNCISSDLQKRIRKILSD